MPLAIRTYDGLSCLADNQALLCLAWTLDEREFLSVDLNEVVARELKSEVAHDLEYINRYFVKDPYGDEMLRQSVAAFFSRTAWSARVTCGAGVISLLHALARLGDDGPAYVAGPVYPDFPFWLTQFGRKCIDATHHATPEEHGQRALAAGAALVFLERPSLVGRTFGDPSDVAALCAAVPDAIVMVDESNANYYPPAFSAANVVDQTDNLVVLRGFSKAYGLGSLRLSYALACEAVTKRIRSVTPPLLASSLSLRLASRLLMLGDVAEPLRQRIKAQKEKAKALFDGAGIHGLSCSGEFLPYLLATCDHEYVASRLESRGIVGKNHPMWADASIPPKYVYRLSVPLRAERIDSLRRRLRAPPADAFLGKVECR